MTRIARTVVLASVCAVLSGAAYAQPAAPAAPVGPATTTVGANLNISPKRITFDRAHRSATVYIYNQGQSAGAFDISLIDRAMLPDGQIIAVADAATDATKAIAAQVKSSQPMLLVSPRRVSLEPGKGQTIRLRVAGDGSDAPGEFRTHLTVVTIPPRDVGLTAEQASGLGANELSFQISSIFGVSIPVIVRNGDLDVRAALENIQVVYEDVSLDGRAAPKRTAFMSIDIVRQGSSSLFGNIEIRPQGQKKSDPIGVARGVGVYTEIGRRNIRVPLNRAPAAGEKFDISFTDDDTSPGKVLATRVAP